MNKRLLEQLKYLEINLNPASCFEFGYLVDAKEELEWQYKTDVEKWENRLGSVSLTRKWSISPLFGEGAEIIDHYFINLVEASKLIVSIFESLKDTDTEEFSKQDIIILRLKSFLSIQKKDMDDFWRPKRHLLKESFSEIIDIYISEIKDVGLIDQLPILKDVYSKMYDSWKDAPTYNK